MWASSKGMHQPWKPCKEHAPTEKAVRDAANSRRHVPDDTSDDSDHGASQNKKEAGSVAGTQGKRKRSAAADSSSAGGRLPRGKKASLSFLNPKPYMLLDLGASAAVFCLGDICGVVGKGSSGRVFAARCA